MLSYNPNLDSDPAYLDTVEQELLEHIQGVQKQLVEARHRRALSKNRGLLRRNPSFSENLLSQAAADHPSITPSNHQLTPARPRIISVSLTLPTEKDGSPLTDHVVHHALPPNALFALQQSQKYSLVSVGITSPSATASTLHSVYDVEHDGVWQSTARRSANNRRSSHRSVAVNLPDEPQLWHNFQFFCEHILWRLLHYDYSALTEPDLEEYWSAYRIINQRFAETISEIYEEGDLIWVHNYFLMLVPGLLRDSFWYAKIGFFFYTPFPTSELFRILPHRTDILKGLTGADLIGFHSYDYAKQFVAACSRLLGVDGTPSAIEIDPARGRRCELGIYPAGIDVRALRNHMSSKAVKSRVAELRARFDGIKIIVGIDRLDDSFCGIPLKLLAFEKLLDDHPALVSRVIMIQVASIPSRSVDMASHRAQQVQVNEIVARINSTFGTLTSSPVHYLNSELESEELYALMCAGHVCVVSTVRDGMGLIPHKWTVCQHGGHRGPIVLSEFSGSAHSFSTALHVNPWDVDEMAETLKEALEMNETSRNMRNEAAYRFVNLHTSKRLGFNFLEDLEQCEKSTSAGASVGVPLLDTGLLINAYLSSSTSTSPVSSSTVLSSMNAAYTQGGISPQTHGENIANMVLKGYAPSARISFSPPMDPRNTRYSDFSGSESTGKSSNVSPALREHLAVPMERSFSGFSRSRRLKLFVLDLEGTLVPYQAIAQLGYPSQHVLDVIQRLVDADPQNRVLLVSTRDRATVTQWLGSLDIYLAAEDGAFFRAPGSSMWTALFRDSITPDYSRPQDPASVPSQGYAVEGSLAPTKRNGDAEDLLSGEVDEENLKERSMFGSFGNLEAQEATANGSQFVKSARTANGSGKVAIKAEDKPYLHDEGARSSEKVSRNDRRSKMRGRDVFMDVEKNASRKEATIPNNKSSVGLVMEKRSSLRRERGSFGRLDENSKRGSNSFASLSSLESTQSGESGVQKWKSAVLPVLQHFAERTPGVILEEGDASLTWHYVDSDSDFGRWQARELYKNLEQFLVRGIYMDIASEEGRRRWIKVRCSGVDKTNAVVQTIEHMLKRASQNGLDGEGELRRNRVGVDFVLCVGDDRADEGMFDLFRDERRLDSLGMRCPANRVFTCRVGSPPTSAKYCLDSHSRVVELIEDLCKQRAAR